MRTLIVVLLSVAALAGQPAERVLTPRDVATLRYVSTAALSPGGETVAYVLTVPRQLFEEDDGAAWQELHVWNKESGSRPYVTGRINVSAVSWTPDGQGIAFLAKRGDDKTRGLYVIPLHGGEARKVLEHDTDIGKFNFLGDGSRVAFTAPEKKDEDAEKLKKKGFKQEIYEENLVYNRVWVAGLDDPEPEKRMLSLDGSANDLVASPDGQLLALGLAPKPLVDHRYMYTRVFIVRADDGEIVHKVDNPGKLGQIRWSPDGEYLAMIAGADQHDPNAGRLYLTSLPSGKTDKYFLEDEGDVVSILWQDNRTLLYGWDEGLKTELRSLNVVNGKVTTVVEHGFPSLAHSVEGRRVVFVGSTPAHPAELFLWEPGMKEARRLTNSNPWLDQVRLAKQEAVRYQARDGLELEGVLIRPLEEKAGQRYPLILDVHGGPESHVRNNWVTSYSRLGQVAAARGFAVFYPNYRASTGRGVAFSKLDQGRPAMEEFDDLVDAANHFIGIGLADEQRVGVTGGSYGGYATAWCSTALSAHFAAGVMFVGISDKISKLGTSDIPDEVYLVHDRHRLWDDWDLFLKQSPIYHVRQAKTPLLILHGKDDPRVPPSQSLELYRSLKTLGQAPVRLVYYPGEGHGNRQAAARYDYNLRALRWFGHYLQEPGGKMPPKELDYGAPKEEKE